MLVMKIFWMILIVIGIFAFLYGAKQLWDIFITKLKKEKK